MNVKGRYLIIFQCRTLLNSAFVYSIFHLEPAVPKYDYLSRCLTKIPCGQSHIDIFTFSIQISTNAKIITMDVVTLVRT